MNSLFDAIPDYIACRIVPLDSGCWRFNGYHHRIGYAQVWDRERGKTYVAHRSIYEKLFGLVRPGLELDHLCRNRWCVNPSHVEPVTHTENVRRGNRTNHSGACQKGHIFTPENTYWNPSGFNACRTCKKEYQYWYWRNRDQRRGVAS